MRLKILRVITLTLMAANLSLALDLQKQTIDAWNSYIARENIDVKRRAANNGEFFWVDLSPSRCARVRAGEILVEQVGKHNSERVPGGLIHHWISAAFIPNIAIEDVLAVTRDYEHYRNYYKPAVADARATLKSEYRDEFILRFVNPSILSKTSLQANYVSNFVRAGGNRWYSTSETTSVHEIKDFGGSNEQDLSPGQGSGFIWRLFSTVRLEDREGGVLMEIEAVALSREIPDALRWCVNPIVRRISRDSIEKSLSQTAEAAREHVRARAAVNQIIGTAPCSRHANDSDLRDQKFPSHPGR